MWLIAGILLGSAGLAFLTSFHTQLHGHVATVVLGTLAAAWLIAMVVAGHGSALLWTLFGVDISLSVGTGTLAYRGLAQQGTSSSSALPRLLGANGVALSELSPRGTVRVNGESWSAESISGPIPSGAEVHVTSVNGIRLEVLAVPTPGELASSSLFDLDAGPPTPGSTLNTEESAS